MVTKFTGVAILLAITMVTTFSTCKKKFGCDEIVYDFQIGVKAHPDQDSINIGDTIWLEVNTPTTLKDTVSNKIIDYSDAANLGSAIGFAKFLNKDSVVFAANSFDYILLQGQSVNNPNITKIREYLFIQENSNYLFKLAVIPKEVGIYLIGFSDADNVYRKSDKCTKAFFKINFIQTNQHYYLNPNYQAGTIQSNSYYFKVK